MKTPIKLLAGFTLALFIADVPAMSPERGRSRETSPARGRSRSRSPQSGWQTPQSETSPTRERSRSRSPERPKRTYWGTPPSLKTQIHEARYSTTGDTNKLINLFRQDVLRLPQETLEGIIHTVVFSNAHLYFGDRIRVLRAFYDISTNQELKDIIFFLITTLSYGEELIKNSYGDRVYVNSGLHRDDPTQATRNSPLERAITQGNFSLIRFLTMNILPDNRYELYQEEWNGGPINFAIQLGRQDIAEQLADRYNELEMEYAKTTTQKDYQPQLYRFEAETEQPE